LHTGQLLDGESMSKTTFKIDELDQAVIEMYRLKLIERWGAFVALEYDPAANELYITQYASCNSWTRGTYRIAYCEEWTSWSDIEIGMSGSGSEIQLRKDIWQEFVHENNLRAKEYHYDLIVSARRFWECIDLNELFADAIKNAQEKLDDAIAESEKEKELEA